MFEGMACPVNFFNSMSYAWAYNVQQFKFGWCPALWAFRNSNWCIDIREVKNNEYVDGDFKTTYSQKGGMFKKDRSRE